MNDESEPPKAPAKPKGPPAAAAKKAPALSSDAPPKKTVSSGKAPSAPVVKDEDIGAGLSKEDAIDLVSDFFSAGNVAKFEDAKWQV